MKRRVLAAVIVFVLVPATAAQGATLRVEPNNVKFGKVSFGATERQTFTITNKSDQTLTVSIQAFVPDTISPGQTGSTCSIAEPSVLGPGESCTHIIDFFADPAPPFADRQTGELLITAQDQSGAVVATSTVKISGRGV